MSEQNVLKGRAAFGDWQKERPSVRRLLKPEDQPPIGKSTTISNQNVVLKLSCVKRACAAHLRIIGSILHDDDVAFREFANQGCHTRISRSRHPSKADHRSPLPGTVVASTQKSNPVQSCRFHLERPFVFRYQTRVAIALSERGGSETGRRVSSAPRNGRLRSYGFERSDEHVF